MTCGQKLRTQVASRPASHSMHANSRFDSHLNPGSKTVSGTSQSRLVGMLRRSDCLIIMFNVKIFCNLCAHKLRIIRTLTVHLNGPVSYPAAISVKKIAIFDMKYSNAS